jgi:inner membrane protein
MDPVTHAIIGASVAKITGNALQISDPATVSIVVGAIVPDIDIILQQKGDLVYLKNHRGATHSLVGTIIQALVISAAVCMVYGTSQFFTMFLWALLGCWSHVGFDLFNSLGAKLLWPFSEVKVSIGMNLSFDPVFMGLLIGYVFAPANITNYFIGGFLIYFAHRAFARIFASNDLQKEFGDRYDKITLLPSLKNPFKWHFVLEDKNCAIVGEKNFLRNKIKVLRRLDNVENEDVEQILSTTAGRFFTEFTPTYHVRCEYTGNFKKYILTDTRYYLKNKFLHHAVVITDKNNTVIRQTFNPYSMNRNCVIDG